MIRSGCAKQLRLFVFKNKRLCISVPLCLQNSPVAIWFNGVQKPFEKGVVLAAF